MKLFNLFTSGALTVDVTPELFFEPENFVDMLSYMGKGMLVIFIIIGVIILATLLINILFSKEK